MSKWEKVKLEDVCEIERGGSPRPIDSYITTSEDGVNWIKISDADRDSKYITKAEQKIIAEGVKKSRRVQPGDFLLTNSMSFGRPYILKIDGCIHDGWLVLRDKNNFFYKEYLYYALSSKSIYEKFKMLAVGGVVNNLNSKIVRQVEFPLPPIEIQKEIAYILDTVHSLVIQQKQQLTELDNLIKSIFYDMFGDPVVNDKGWDLYRVEDVCAKIYGGGTPTKKKKEYYQGNIPWVTPKDMKSIRVKNSIDQITELAIQNSSAKLVPANSVLMVIRSGILKRTLPVAINEVEVSLNQDMKAFVPKNNVVADYLLYFFIAMEKNILKHIRGVTADNIEFNIIKNLNIPLPPISHQNEFARIVEKIEEQKAQVRKAMDEAQMLFDSLMSKYFDD